LAIDLKGFNFLPKAMVNFSWYIKFEPRSNWVSQFGQNHNRQTCQQVKQFQCQGAGRALFLTRPAWTKSRDVCATPVGIFFIYLIFFDFTKINSRFQHWQKQPRTPTAATKGGKLKIAAA
jgi:hypothetical protein